MLKLHGQRTNQITYNGIVEPVTIQRFRIVAKLGAGGMGTVYRAYDPQLEREVAIKILKTAEQSVVDELSTLRTVDVRKDATTASGLLAEARIMARLSHPNVVPVYEVGLDGESVFVVMELVDGTDLRDWLESPRQTPAILDVLAQAARGLAAAHASTIVHRDFKPENVLVGRDGRVRVADFGLSRIVGPQAVVRIGDVGGTPKYMAPELWQKGQSTAATDVFALCTTVFEAFGALEAETAAARAHVLRTRGVPAALCALLEAGRAEHPAARPPIQQIADALAGQRSRTLAVALGVAAVAVIGAGIAIAVATKTDAAPACTDDPMILASHWNDTKRAALRTKLPADAMTDRALAAVDASGKHLIASRREVCEAQRAGAITAKQAEQRAGCVERRAIELGATVADLDGRDKVEPIDLQERATVSAATCQELELDVTGDVAPLYARLAKIRVGENGKGVLAELAAIEKAAAEAGDGELETRTAILLGIRQRYADLPAESGATLERAYRRAIAIKSTNQQAIALVERSQVAIRLNDIKAAASFAQLARDLTEKPGLPARTRIRVYRSLGRAKLLAADYAAAQELLERGMAIMKESGQEVGELEILLRIDLTDALVLGDREGGLPLALETAARSKVVLGDRSHVTALAVNQVGKAYAGIDVEKSLEYRRAALALMTARLEPDHAEVLHQRGEVAAMLNRAGHGAEAVKELEDLLAIAERKPGSLPQLGHWMSRLARATFDSGAFELGFKRYDAALERLVPDLGAEAQGVLIRRVEYTDLLVEGGKLAEAEKQIAGFEKIFAKQNKKEELADIQGTLKTRIHLQRGEFREAESDARLALAAFDELKSTERDQSLTKLALATAVLEQGRHAEAKQLLEHVLDVRKHSGNSPDIVAAIEVELARAEYALGAHAEAIERAKRARDVLDRYPGQPIERKTVATFLAHAKP